MARKSKKASKKIQKEVKKQAKNFAKKNPVLAIILAIVLVAVAVGGYFLYKELSKKPVVGEISFHFLTLGNKYSGDCVYIKAGDKDILIDAGSQSNSVTTIKNYLDDYVTDNKLEYVIATHGHEDHIAGFAVSDGSIFDHFECEVIIDFPKTKVTSATYDRYVAERDAEVQKGAKHFTALQCYLESVDGAKRSYSLSESVTMEILYNYYYDHSTSNENDNSVCVQFSHGDRKFLLTGDLEVAGEEYLVQYNNLSQVELYKAGHHGSNTSSHNALLDVIKPKKCVVTCACGWNEYTDEVANQFPTQDFINRISAWTTEVYVTTMADPNYTNGALFVDMNGNVIVYSDVDKVKVQCSNNSVLLKDTDWFKNNRTCPSNWAS